ncbi:MAG: CoF synthetase [Pseudomonadota bacterium]
MKGLGTAIGSFATTLLLSRQSLSRTRFERVRERALNHWLAHDLPKALYYGAAPQSLSDLPIIDKAIVMEAFERFNIHGVTAADAWAAADGSGQIGSLTLGASTGTSGNRGLFVISDTERFRWLGTILAKTMADLLWRRQRVAIMLPRNTRLYESARATGRVQLRFFDLTRSNGTWLTDLVDFDPTVVVAPPKILRSLAEDRVAISPLRLFSAAETLDPVDRPVIETYFQRRLDQIYMATEGLFAVTCRRGGLHLAEDSVFFEFESAGNGLVSPIVTAFRRQTQIMARYRMNDLLRLSETRCPCGSPLRTVDEIVGRMDDVFHLSSPGGNLTITPDVLRDAVLGADRRIDDFRLVQTAHDAIELRLDPDLPNGVADAAMGKVRSLLNDRGARARIRLVPTRLTFRTDRKLRRVARCIKADRPS